MKINHYALNRAIDVLIRAELKPKHVFGNDGAGGYEEVELGGLF